MTDVVSGTRRAMKELVDGTIRVQIDIDPQHRKDFLRLFGEIDMPVAIAPLAPGFEQPDVGHDYGQKAKILKQSSFFRTPEVWAAVGPDVEFTGYLRGRPCAYCGNEPSEVAHVRRVANGAGTGVKPPYSAIPLCHQHHAEQHQRGESALGGKDWFDRKLIEYLENWCWESLKQQFGYESWKFIPPHVLHEWAIKHGVEQYVPDTYTDA